MVTLFWIIAIVFWFLSIWAAAVARWISTGNQGELADLLGGEDSPRWTRLAPKLDDVGETLRFKALIFQVIFLATWTGAWSESATPGWIAGDVALPWWSLFFGALVAVALLWLGPVAISAALAKYTGALMTARSRPLLVWATLGGRVIGWMPRFVDEVVKRLSGANLRENGKGSDAEAALLRSIEQQQREGAIDEGAAAMLENVVDFASTDVGEVMTPRTEIEGIEYTDDLAAIRSFIRQEGHSRIPVYEEDLDHIAGILYVKDLVPFLGEDAAQFALRPLLRRPIVVPDTKPVQDLLADFQNAEVHMAIVVDEYGGTAGLVTIEDVLEEIVGEIYDEHEDGDDEEPDLTEFEDGTWEVDARFHIDDFNEALELDLPEEEEFDTIGGWALAQAGRVPDPGEVIQAHDLRCTVLEAMPTHIVRLKVERAKAAE
ncbi:MAG: hemolysin family protein [Phycisphaerales bacterium]|nr:hemolysin family protein [Phycisphaerales bacterium]